MKRSVSALLILLVAFGSHVAAEGDTVLVPRPSDARYRIRDTRHGTLLLDSATGHSWRLEFQEKSGYVWSQIPRAMMKDPGFPVDNPLR